MEFTQKLISSRGGTLLLAGLAGLLAIIAVVVYVQHYKSSVRSGGQPATVLVSSQLIPKGTAGSVIAANHLFQTTRIRVSDVQTGALVDPASLAGKATAVDIYPGQQLTAADFVVATGGVVSQLTGTERAVTLPFDSARGLIGTLRAGDHVDIYAGFNVIPVDRAGNPTSSGGRPVLREIVADVPVLSVAGGTGGGGLTGGGSNGTNIMFKVNATDAANLAFASDNGKLWLVLRPAYGAKPAPPNIVSAETLLLGLPPIQELKILGGRR